MDLKSALREHIRDPGELEDYRLRKRKEFEDALRRQRHRTGTWIAYAQFEEAQLEFERARSVYERALEVDVREPKLWMRYINVRPRPHMRCPADGDQAQVRQPRAQPL